jgi:prepilin-type N-terminal cleavage/methylation domain-containing protein
VNARTQNPNVVGARHGYTLMEVLLTLAIVTFVAAMAWPTLARPMAERRLRAAAEGIRTEWSHARIEAMRSGRAQAFRYETGGGHYSVASESVADSAASATGASLTTEIAPNDAQSADGAPAATKVGTLPEGFMFRPPEAAAGAETTSVPVEALADAGDGWSVPILFLPDGTATDVWVVLGNAEGSVVRVSLRGVTGSATVADVVPNVE